MLLEIFKTFNFVYNIYKKQSTNQTKAAAVIVDFTTLIDQSINPERAV